MDLAVKYCEDKYFGLCDIFVIFCSVNGRIGLLASGRHALLNTPKQHGIEGSILKIMVMKFIA